MAERSKARAWKVRIRQKRIVGSNPTPSAILSSRTSPSPENALHFFEDFKGICEGDRTLETGERAKIGLRSPFVSFRPNLAKIGLLKESHIFSMP